MSTLPDRVRLLLVLGLLSPVPAWGEVIEFIVDPVESTIQVDAGNDLTIPLALPLNSVTIPAVAPTIGTGGTLPDGTTSDGLETSLEGSIIVDLDDAFASIRIIGRRSSIRFGDSGSWLPGPPGATAVPTPGEIAVEFSDATTLISGNAVLRETTFSLDSGASETPLTEQKTNVYSFPAGCSAPPCPNFVLEDGTVDVETTINGPLRAGLRSDYSYRSPAGTTGTLERLANQTYKLTIPFELATTLAPEDIQAAVPTTIDLAYSGTIVAVPEPSAIALSLLALGVVLGLLAWRDRRNPWRAAALVAVAVAVACAGLPKINSGAARFTGATSCANQLLRTTKNNGGSQLGLFTDLACLLFGFSGTIDGSAFRLYPYARTMSMDPLARYLVAGVSVTAMETFATELELHQEASYSTTYGAQEGQGDAPQFYVRAIPFNYGVDIDLFGSAHITVNFDKGTSQFPADNLFRYFPLDALGGDIGMDVEVDSERITEGIGYQGVALSFGIRGSTCFSNHQCKDADPAKPFCGPTGCHAGDDAQACDHDVQCNGDLGDRCNSGGTCSRGAAGDFCMPDEADCNDEHSCDAAMAMCKILF